MKQRNCDREVVSVTPTSSTPLGVAPIAFFVNRTRYDDIEKDDDVCLIDRPWFYHVMLIYTQRRIQQTIFARSALCRTECASDSEP